jgi:hypothetical protein
VRAIVTFGCDYPESLRPAFEELAAAGEVAGLSPDDLTDAIESGSDFTIIEVEVVD